MRRDLYEPGSLGGRGSVGWAGQASLVGEDDELGAVTGAQFGHGVVGVCLDGQRAEGEVLGDLGV